MKRRKRLLAGLLCAVLSVTTVMPTGMQVSAKQLKQDGQNLVAEETANNTTKPGGQDIEAGTEGNLKNPETQAETDTEGSAPEISGAESDPEESKDVSKPEFGTEDETEAEIETEIETELETEMENATAEVESETETETETETEDAGETEEDEVIPESPSADIMLIPAEAGEYPNAEIPFEIGGTDIYAGLGGASSYRVSKVDITAAKYDPRTEAPEEMTAVGNQNPYGTCWAFAMMATLENSMIRQGFSDNSINLSERHLAYFARNSGSDILGNASDDSIVSEPSDTYLTVGGNAYVAAVRLMNWQGAATEAAYPYSGNALSAAIDASKAQDTKVLAHDVYFVPTKNAVKEDKINAVKKLIAEYGCVQWSYYHSNAYYNAAAKAYYDPKHTSTNHAITVVGWDDDYPAQNFGNTGSDSADKPTGNGAWIVKNSWGTEWGENGYFYISYEDTSLGSGNPASVSVAAQTDTYDHNYFYGNTAYLPGRLNGYSKVAQVYQVQSEEEQLQAVSFMLYSEKADYSIQIYKNPELIDGVVEDPESGEAMLKTPQTGTTGYAGFYTIDLAEPVSLSKGDYAAIVIEASAVNSQGVRARAFFYMDRSDTQQINASGKTYEIENKNEVHAGQSFYYSLGWKDAAKGSDPYNFRINALTVDAELVLSEKRLELAPNRVRRLGVVQRPVLEGGAEAPVSFTTSDSGVVTVSEEGILTGISAGEAVVTAKAKDRNGDEVTASCKVTVTDAEDIAGGVVGDLIWFIDANGKLTVEGSGDFAPPGSEEESANVIGQRRAPWYRDPENSGNRWYEQITSAEIKVTGMTDTSYMFFGCSKLADVDFEAFDTSQVTNMTRMFDSCRGLKKLDLSGFDTGNVQYMRNVFRGCENLESLELGSIDTGNVTDMYGLFEFCSNLKEIDLGHFNTGKVTDMSRMFAECQSLANIDVSRFDTSNVTDMTRMFLDCWNLTALDLSHFDTKKVTGMTWMFYDCKRLVTVDLSSFDMGETASEKINYGKPDQLSDMFKGCSALSVIYTPANLPHSVTLPLDGEDDIWYQPEGEWCPSGETKITELPKELAYSILITKNERPKVSYLTVQKTKTDYECGESLALDDLTADYVNSRGFFRKLTEKDYSTNADEIDLSIPGTKTLIITHVDAETGKEVTAQIELTAVYILKEGSLTVRLSGDDPDGTCVYDGTPKTPALEVKTNPAGKVLTEGEDYTAVYENNLNAGTALVTVTGQNDYQGTVPFSFSIRKAAAPETEEIEICYPAGKEQKEQTIDIAGRFKEYGEITGYRVGYTENTEDGRHIFSGEPYITDGLLYYGISAGTENDEAAITVEISFANYEDTAVVLHMKFMNEAVLYTVTFDMTGHGTAIPPITVYGQGGLIEEPKQPEEEGYRFTGWYKDRECTEPWDFHSDMVEDNMTLYAGWLAVPQRVIIPGELFVQEIQNQTYTGSPIKPVLQVYTIAKDGKEILLKQGKDYTIKFYNHTNADSVQKRGGVSATGEEGDNGFTKSLPYAVITGKGNYTGTMYKNFHIDPAVIAEKDSAAAEEAGNTTLAKGFTLKYKDQLTSAKKAQKPFTSIKYKKSMKLGRDYTLQLSVLAAYDAQGNAFRKGAVIGTAGSTLQDTIVPAIPAGAKGTFLLTVTGKGNYSGTVKKTVYVSDKTHLIKNASVVLGKNQKKTEYTGEDIFLTPAYYDASAKKYYGFKEQDGKIFMDTETEVDKNHVFTVKIGKTYLKYGEDFTVTPTDYVNNNAVGTATMTIRGIGEYSGTKNITFRITGTAFNLNNISIDGMNPFMEYTGKALTQNGIVLKGINGIKSGEELVYRKDYTISYKNNLKKGTATMTFTAKPSSGYTGSFKKTFQIHAVTLAAAGAAEDTVTVITAASLRSDGKIAAKGDTAGGNTPENLAEEDGILYTNVGIRFTGKVTYTKAGAKISDRICLQNKEGFLLKEGTDYTVSYSGNKAVTTSAAAAPPVMKIKGKGNYAGELAIVFEISKASLEENENISAAQAAVAYNKAKAADYEYHPKVKVTDGKQVLSEKNDYEITYHNCKQAEVKSYLETLESLEGASKEKVEAAGLENKRPYALITAKGERNYEGSCRVSLTVYQNKLTGSNLYVVLTEDEAQLTYTGEQVVPEVTVYYGEPKAVRKAKSAKVTDEKTLLRTYGLKKLVVCESENGADHGYGDYMLTYGVNTAAGKNKGSVTITGANLYGGSVKVKFTILRKDVYTVLK